MRYACFACLLAFVAFPSAGLNAPPADPGQAQSEVEPPKPMKEKKDKPKDKPWSFELFGGVVYDTNINQDKEGLDSVGYIAGLGTTYATKFPGGGLEVSYVIAQNAYTNTDTWDRISQNGAATLDYRLADKWYARTTGEVALNDISDDGDLRDEMTLVQRFEYRFTPVYRLRLEGALRKKDYIDDDTKDADDPYVEVGFDQRLSGNRRWLAYYRYDHNDANDPRRSYERSTFGLLHSQERGKRNAASLDARYRLYDYTDRLVNTPSGPKKREDKSWLVEYRWDHALKKSLTLRFDYVFENRTSNDPRRDFTDNTFGLWLIQRW